MRYSCSAIDAYIGKKMQYRREHLSISRQQLGEMIDNTPDQIQKLEQGTDRAGGKRLHSIAVALQVDPFFFFEGMSQEESIMTPECIEEDPHLSTLMKSYSQINDDNLKNNLSILIKSIIEDANKAFLKLGEEA